jgi:hypothetical protein
MEMEMTEERWISELRKRAAEPLSRDEREAFATLWIRWSRARTEHRDEPLYMRLEGAELTAFVASAVRARVNRDRLDAFEREAREEEVRASLANDHGADQSAALDMGSRLDLARAMAGTSPEKRIVVAMTAAGYTSREVAASLSARRGGPMSAAAVRKTLQRLSDRLAA